MNRLFLINDDYYVLAFDYYDAIVKFKNYKNNYDEEVVDKIELISNDVINIVEKKNCNEDYDDEE